MSHAIDNRAGLTSPRVFREDINGLRALAVAAVVAFHFAAPGFGGGFVGVDMFFVISGFLMTGIIVGRLDQGRFALGAFYLDRARRIVPALAVLLAALLLWGSYALFADELLALGKRAASAAVFASNMLFAAEASYFETAAESNFVLHTWSLSVEWQFYLLYPLLLMALFRIVPRVRLAMVLTLVMAASFALMLVVFNTSPRAAFFQLPTRAWEMLAGGVIWFAPRSIDGVRTRALQLAGFVLIAMSVVASDAAHWPGLMTVLPVVGAALVISAHRDNSRWANNGAVRWLGTRSYSVYLWHWPFAVGLRRDDLFGEPGWVAAALIATLVLAELSYRFVEQRFVKQRRAEQVRAPLRAVLAHARFAVPGLALAVTGTALWASRGLPQRFPPELRALDVDAAPGGPFTRGCFVTSGPPTAACRVGGREGGVATYYLGDSHSEATSGGFAAALPAGGLLAFNGYADCAPIIGAHHSDPDNRCEDFIARFVEPLTRPRTTPVVLAAAWLDHRGRGRMIDVAGQPILGDKFDRLLVQTACRLASAGPTWIVLPTPRFPDEVVPLLRRRIRSDGLAAADVTIPEAAYRQAVAPMQAAFAAVAACGVRLLDPAPLLCAGGVCRGSDKGRALFRDEHHMTEFGNRRLTPMFAKVFAAPLSSTP